MAAAGTAQGAERDSGPSGRERLVAQPPPGWKMSYRHSVAGLEVWEFLPQGQSLENWRDMITAQAISGEESNPPRALLTLVAERARTICLEVLSSPIDEQPADGLAGATMAQFCVRDSKGRRGDLTLYRAIRGKHALYVLSRTRRDESYDGKAIPLPEAALAQWRKDLEQFRVCRDGEGGSGCGADY